VGDEVSKMYLGLAADGRVDTWTSIPIEGYTEINEADLPEDYLAGFGQRRWVCVNGSLVERENWLAEWEESVRVTAERSAEAARLEQERLAALEETPE
jgi:hypothetical protein